MPQLRKIFVYSEALQGDFAPGQVTIAEEPYNLLNTVILSSGIDEWHRTIDLPMLIHFIAGDNALNLIGITVFESGCVLAFVT